MNDTRIKKFKGIDNPKIVLLIIGLMGISAIGKIFSVPDTGFFTGLFLGIILSFVFRMRLQERGD